MKFARALLASLGRSLRCRGSAYLSSNITSPLRLDLGSNPRRTAALASDLGLSGELSGDGLYKLTLTVDGEDVVASGLEKIATGLRNAAGLVFHPATGDLYLQDNGIDGLSDPNEPHSADELETLVAAATPESLVDEAQFSARLNAALSTLAPVARAVIYLKLRDGMSHDEIARHLGITTRRVRRQLTHAYAHLRRNVVLD